MKRIILAALVGVLVSGPGSAEAKTTFIECTNVGASIFGKERWDRYKIEEPLFGEPKLYELVEGKFVKLNAQVEKDFIKVWGENDNMIKEPDEYWIYIDRRTGEGKEVTFRLPSQAHIPPGKIIEDGNAFSIKCRKLKDPIF